MSPNSNHLNFTFCAGCSRILILHSMAGLCWLVTGLLYLRGWSSLLWKEETVPGLHTALCWPGLRSWTAARVISVHRGCSLLRTRGSHCYSHSTGLSCLLSTEPDHGQWWTLTGACGLWWTLQLLQTSSVRTQLATTARWSRGPVTTAIVFSNCDIDVHWIIMVPIKYV